MKTEEIIRNLELTRDVFVKGNDTWLKLNDAVLKLVSLEAENEALKQRLELLRENTLKEKPAGEWEINGMNPNGVIGNFQCSICNGVSLKDSKFCPHCGANMKGE